MKKLLITIFPIIIVSFFLVNNTEAKSVSFEQNETKSHIKIHEFYYKDFDPRQKFYEETSGLINSPHQILEPINGYRMAIYEMRIGFDIFDGFYDSETDAGSKNLKVTTQLTFYGRKSHFALDETNQSEALLTVFGPSLGPGSSPLDKFKKCKYQAIPDTSNPENQSVTFNCETTVNFRARSASLKVGGKRGYQSTTGYDYTPWYSASSFDGASLKLVYIRFAIEDFQTPPPPTPEETIISQNDTVINQNNQIINNQNNMNAFLSDSTPPQVDNSKIPSVGLLPPGPLDSILNLPLNIMTVINGSLSGNCQDIQLPLPYVGKNLTLPCFDKTIYKGSFRVALDTISLPVVAFIMFYYLKHIKLKVERAVSMGTTEDDEWGIL